MTHMGQLANDAVDHRKPFHEILYPAVLQDIVIAEFGQETMIQNQIP
jgi:hypothetical protein